MQRRAFLAAVGAAALARSAHADTPVSEDLEIHDLVLSGDPKIARRSLLLMPKHLPKGTRVPLLILLHGLGETGNELLGIHAWGERYGLVSSYERLRRAPVERVFPKLRYLTDEHQARLNKSLEKKPFAGLCLVCPVTPNPYKVGPAERTLDRYTEWIADTLLPAVRERAPVLTDPRSTGLDGCSLGGYVGVEVFLRRPELFGSFGGIQSAFGVPLAQNYADRIAAAIRRVGPRAIRVATSSGDPYRRANEALSQRLDELGVPNVLSVLPGPHNQPWLREIGTLELLRFHDRQLARSA